MDSHAARHAGVTFGLLGRVSQVAKGEGGLQASHSVLVPCGPAKRLEQKRPGENGWAFLDECEAHVDPLGTDWELSGLDASEQVAQLG